MINDGFSNINDRFYDPNKKLYFQNDMNLSEEKKQPLRAMPSKSKKNMLIMHHKGSSHVTICLFWFQYEIALLSILLERISLYRFLVQLIDHFLKIMRENISVIVKCYPVKKIIFYYIIIDALAPLTCSPSLTNISKF